MTERHTKRMLNVPLLIGTLVALVALAPAAYAWHAWQVRRTADSFLKRAESLEAEEDWQSAATHLSLYLRFRPNDFDARIRLAEVFDKSAQDFRSKANAVDLLYFSLGLAPSAPSDALSARLIHLRVRLAELLLDLRRFAAAESEAKTVLDTGKDSGPARRVLALARYGQQQSGITQAPTDSSVPIGTEFERALEAEPGNVQLSSVLARIYREETNLLDDQTRALSETERQHLADQVIDQMVEGNSKAPEAYLARYRYRLRYGLPGGEDDLLAALRVGPDDRLTRLTAAGHAREKAVSTLQNGGSPDDAKRLCAEARGHYQYVIDKIAPKDEAAYLGLGDMYLVQGESDRAVAAWQQGLREANEDSLLLNMKLAELLVSEGRLETVYPNPSGKENPKNPLRALARVIDQARPKLPPAAVAELVRAVDLLKARWLIRKGERLEAIPLLKNVLSGQPSTPEEIRQSVQSEMLLGQVYGDSGDWDLAAAAFERAASLEPKAVRARMAAAGAWVAADQPEKAIRHFEAILSLDEAAAKRDGEHALSAAQRAEAWLALAGAEFRRQLRLSQKERNWNTFAKALDEAKSLRGDESFADPWRVELLEADSLVVQGEDRSQKDQGIQQAIELLRKTETEYATSTKLLQGLALTYERLQTPDDADRAVAKYEGLVGESGAGCLLRAELLSGREQYDEARKVLQQGLKKLPVQVHAALEHALAQVNLRDGKTELSETQLRDMQARQPTNQGLVRQLIEIAFERGKLEDVRHWEGKLRELEGPNGLYSQYCEARRLLLGAKSSGDPEFTRATELLAQLQQRRPNWSHVRFLSGMAAQAQGDLDGAIAAYQDVIRLGARRAATYERLVQLLLQKGRADEAATYIAQAKQYGLNSTVLDSLEVAAAREAGQLDRAVEIAREGVDKNPKDPLAQLSYGGALLASQRTAEAEGAFRQAVSNAPGDVRTYLALFSCYVQGKQPDLARKTLADLAENVKDLSKPSLALLLAQSYEHLGDVAEAEARYREAHELEPESESFAMHLTNFLLRSNKTDEAEKVLRGVIELAPRSVSARQALAKLLVQRGGAQEWQEAQQLLEQSDADTAVLGQDQRLQAFLLVQRGGQQNRDRAQKMLETLIADPKEGVDADRLLLALVYEGQGKLPAARDQYLSLVERAEPNAAYLEQYVDFLLRNEDASAAEPRLKKLEQMLPDNVGVVRLRARWLRATGRSTEVEPLVEGMAKRLLEKVKQNGADDRAESQLSLAIGDLYTAVDMHQVAERWYRRVFELVPQRYEPLALSLAKQGRTQEAIGLCTKAAGSDESSRAATVLASILLAGKPTKADFGLAEPTLTEAIEKHKDDISLLFGLASVRIKEERPDDAAKLYRQVLRIQPKHLLALNNLATLLSEQPAKSQEAIECIDKAIGIAGEQPAFLDTKGMALLHGGKPGDAVPLLSAAASSVNADPRYDFHLAAACLRVGDMEKAKAAYEKATHGNVLDQFLTDADQKLMAELQQKFDR